MKPRKINRSQSLPCDPGLGCTYPNCRCNLIMQSDAEPMTPMFMLGRLLIVISGLIVIWFITVIVKYWQEIKEFSTSVWSVILINKTAGGLTILFILTVVYFVIVGYSKRENF